jgi:hypothetical protein
MPHDYLQTFLDVRPATVFVSFLLPLLVALFTPLVLFLLHGWPSRKRSVTGLFSDEAVRLYYRAFFPADVERAAYGRKKFIEDFDQRYGRRFYFLPIVVFIAVVLAFVPPAVWAMVGYIRELTQRYADNVGAGTSLEFDLGHDVPPILVTAAGIAGAYMWVLYDFISRERNLDFSTSDINHASFRFAIGIPVALAIAFVTNDGTACSLALLAGAFPTEGLMRLMRLAAATRLRQGWRNKIDAR